MATTNKDKTVLNARDLELIAKAWLCFKEQPQIDMAKFAEKAGYKNQNVARVSWANVRNKLIAMEGSGGGADLGAPASGGGGGGGGSTTKRKATKATAPSTVFTPIAPRTTSTGGRFSGAASGEDDSDTIGTPTRPKTKKQRVAARNSAPATATGAGVNGTGKGKGKANA